MDYSEFCETTFAVRDQRSARKMLDRRWEQNLSELQAFDEDDLRYFAASLLIQNLQLFKYATSHASNSETFDVTSRNKHYEDIGALVTTFRLPAIADAPKEYNYHLAFFFEKPSPSGNDYELHASSENIFEVGEPCYPRSLDPNFDREGKLAGFNFNEEEFMADPRRVVAGLRSARFTIRSVYELASLEPSHRYLSEFSKSPEAKLSSE